MTPKDPPRQPQSQGLFIPMTLLSFCPDCEGAVDSLIACPRCGNRFLLPLAPVLNRPQEER